MKKLQLYSFLFLTMGALSGYAQSDDAPADSSAAVRRTTQVQRQDVPTRVVTGRVLSAATGQGLGGALVHTSDLSGYSTLTEADGSYELRVPVFAASLTVTAPDHARG